jgi:hypothetical protein
MYGYCPPLFFNIVISFLLILGDLNFVFIYGCEIYGSHNVRRFIIIVSIIIVIVMCSPLERVRNHKYCFDLKRSLIG